MVAGLLSVPHVIEKPNSSSEAFSLKREVWPYRALKLVAILRLEPRASGVPPVSLPSTVNDCFRSLLALLLRKINPICGYLEV